MGPKQIVIHLPNTYGQLSGVSELLGENGINIIAVCANLDGDQRVCCMVLDDHEKAMRTLQAANYQVRETPIIAAYGPDHPGGLNAVIKPLKDAEINVERLYLSVARKNELALIIIEVDKYEAGVEILKSNYVDLIEGPFRF